MKFAIYQPVFVKARSQDDERWTVRLEVIGTAEHCRSPEHAMQLAREAGFPAPIVGEFQETEQ